MKITNQRVSAIICGLIFSGSLFVAGVTLAFPMKMIAAPEQPSLTHAPTLKISPHLIYYIKDYGDDEEEHTLPCNYGHPHCQCFDDHCVQQE